MRSGANSMPVAPSADFSSSDDWSYVASTGGITNTTPVVLCGAPPPAVSGEVGMRAVITRLDVLNSHATVDPEASIAAL